MHCGTHTRWPKQVGVGGPLVSHDQLSQPNFESEREFRSHFQSSAFPHSWTNAIVTPWVPATDLSTGTQTKNTVTMERMLGEGKGEDPAGHRDVPGNTMQKPSQRHPFCAEANIMCAGWLRCAYVPIALHGHVSLGFQRWSWFH